MLRKFRLLLFETDVFQLFDGYERDVCVYLDSALYDSGKENTDDGGQTPNEIDKGKAPMVVVNEENDALTNNIVEEDSGFSDSDYNVDFDSDNDSDDNNFDENIDHGVDDINTTSSDSSGENGIEISGDDFDSDLGSEEDNKEPSYPVFNPSETFHPTFEIGMIFSTKNEFKDAIHSYAIRIKRNLKITSNDKKRIILEARKKPILTMLEWIREYLMVKMQQNRDRATKRWGDKKICPKIKKIGDKNVDKAADCIPIKANDWNYEISCYDGARYTVNLVTHACSCRKWELTGILCKHG
ncbi:UNVERIFIED_CONTAM: hypothetical protein Sradi_4114200 [Sesamum radiatum]|uniref:SWIM-type domain-containing protein n=1 Tax=Sesamum radiatum TaxID=300843 RepID=A0AAW2P0I9_SESRA